MIFIDASTCINISLKCDMFEILGLVLCVFDVKDWFYIFFRCECGAPAVIVVLVSQSTTDAEESSIVTTGTEYYQSYRHGPKVGYIYDFLAYFCPFIEK